MWLCLWSMQSCEAGSKGQIGSKPPLKVVWLGANWITSKTWPDNKPHALSKQRCRGEGSAHTNITMKESTTTLFLGGLEHKAIQFRQAGKNGWKEGYLCIWSDYCWGLPLCWKAFLKNTTPHQHHWVSSVWVLPSNTQTVLLFKVLLCSTAEERSMAGV